MAVFISSDRSSEPAFLARLWLGGCIALSVITWICLSLQFSLSTTGFCMLVVIVFLSLLDSFVSSAIFSVAGALLLNFFFTPPIYSFAVQKVQDFFPLAAFLAASLSVTALVRRIRDAEHIQREQALLLDLTHDAVSVRNRSEVIAYWNHSAEALYGWRRAEALGQAADVLLKTTFPIPRDAIQQQLEQDGYWEGELSHTKRDGTEVIVASRWTLQRDSRGEPLATLQTDSDITERKRAEDSLKKSQALYLAEAQKLSRTGSFGWNIDTGELFLSEEALRIFEYDATLTPTLDDARQRVHPEDMPTFDRMVSDVNGVSDRFDIEHRLLLPDGRVRHLHVVARRAEGHADKRHFFGAVMDITQARLIEAQLYETQNDLARASRVAALGELSASIAHEVGQPLAAIVMNGEACSRWLRRSPPDLSEVEGCVARITAEGKRAGEIVQRVRRMVKGAALDLAAVSINDLVDEVLTLIRAEAKRHGCIVVLHLTPEVTVVDGDRVQLQQVLINLIMNSLQSMATLAGEHRLHITSSLDLEGHVLLSLADNGPGISEEHLPRLFDAFFTTRSAGMGMGLAICNSIVGKHGGRIWAANNPDGGATFTFKLPLARASVSVPS
ncbi:ATP-binding protein [Paraburkholderia sp. BCC1884]|uniref:ATP-binding protein n=1 Tax=Paraburkholderia sp. BCC1884 TaxID=2562668 RepID=UPI0021B3C8BF|nr:ATP-binding protein [Paraburkholderia sp. BCC1884]